MSGKAQLSIRLLARYFIVTKNHFSRPSQHRIVLNQMVHLLAHLPRIVGLLIDEVVHVADFAVDHIEQPVDGRLALLGKRLRQLSQLLHTSALIKGDLMHFALLVDEEHFALRFLAPTEHIDVGKRIDLFFTIDIDEMSHLLLSYLIDDGIFLVFRHDQLEQVHVFAPENRHLCKTNKARKLNQYRYIS